MDHRQRSEHNENIYLLVVRHFFFHVAVQKNELARS